MDSTLEAPVDGAIGLRDGLVLCSVCLAGICMSVSLTGTAVVLPLIGQALSCSSLALNWATNAFMLAFGSTLMATGAAADAHGRRRVFLSGVALFSVTSAFLMFAPNILAFNAVRALQGFGAAASLSGGMAVLAQRFNGSFRLRAFSLLGVSFGLGIALGPIAAGFLADAFGWRSVFALTFGLTAVSTALATAFVEPSRDPDARGIDWPGSLSFTAMLTTFTFGLLLAPDRGWTSPIVLGLLGLAAALLVAFVRIELGSSRPMLDLTLFRYPRFVGVQLLAMAPAYSFVVLLVLLPVRFVGVEGMTSAQAGTLMISIALPLLVLPFVAGYLVRWVTVGLICAVGLSITAAGILWLALYPVGSASAAYVIPMLVIGTGISLPWGLMDGLAVSVVPNERAGMAAGIFSTMRVAGECVALAVVGALFPGLIVHRLGADLSGLESTAAQRLATGDLSAALRGLPSLSRVQVTMIYGDAFGTLLTVLAVISLVIAAVVFAFLGRDRAVVARG